MHRMTNVLISLVALLAITAGFILPDLTAALQDYRLNPSVESYPSQAVQFSAVSDMRDALLFVSNGYEQVELETAPNHTEESIYQVAQDFLLFYQENLDGDYLLEATQHEAHPFLAISTKESTIKQNEIGKKIFHKEFMERNDEQAKSTVLWECKLQDAMGREMILTIDDRSGKVLSFWFRGAKEERMTNQMLRLLLSRWASISSPYYGMLFSDSGLSYSQKTGQKYKNVETVVQFGFITTFSDSSGISLELPFVMGKNMIGFNVYPS